MKQRILPALLGLAIIVPGMAHAGFPEIPFCPLGGPPGWFNTLFDLDDRPRYPPPYVRYPSAYAPPPAPGYFYPAVRYPASPRPWMSGR